MRSSYSLFEDLKHRLGDPTLSLKPALNPTGIESWFPYYAGYSTRFVEETLSALRLRSGAIVLDPWNGAGTTTTVADANGYDARGFDLNPVAALVASARLVRAEDARHSLGLAKELLSVADRQTCPVDPSDPLLLWLTKRATRRYRSIESAILSLLGTYNGRVIDLRKDTPPPFASFFVLCTIRAAKQFAKFRANSNPTWSMPEERADFTESVFDKAFVAVVESYCKDIQPTMFDAASKRPSSSAIMRGDVRAIPLKRNGVDAVITSPPYCTRLDYFKATQFELAALHIDESTPELRAMRECAMGTNLMRKEQGEENELPTEVRAILKRIKSHPSKASDTYYYKHFLQYFVDANCAVKEIHRVLKPGRCAVLVVQSSYYKSIRVTLADVYESLARSVGMSACTVLSVPVRKTLASINSRATQYRRQRRYTEDVVAMVKGG